MPQVVLCQGCNRKLRVPDALGGKIIRCPKCAYQVHVIVATAAAAPPPAKTAPVRPAVVGTAQPRPAAKPKAKPPAQPPPARGTPDPLPRETPANGLPAPRKLPPRTAIPSRPAPPKDSLTETPQSPPQPEPEDSEATAESILARRTSREAPPKKAATPRASAPEDDSPPPSGLAIAGGLAGVAFGFAALAVACLLANRTLAITLAGVGLGLVVLTSLPGWKKRQARAWTCLALGGFLSSVALLLIFLAPGLLNTIWSMEKPLAKVDLDQQTRLPRDQPRSPGTPLGAGEAVDAASEAIRMHNIVVRLESVKLEPVTEGGQPVLRVHFRLTNGGEAPIRFEGFGDKHMPLLTSDAGASYRFLEQHYRQENRTGLLFGPAPQQAVDVLSGGRLDHVLIFEPAAAGFEPVTLTLPASAWGRKGTCKLRVAEIFAAGLSAPPAP